MQRRLPPHRRAALAPAPGERAHELYSLSEAGTDFNGKPSLDDSYSYPVFKVLRDTAKGDADLAALAIAGREDVVFGGGESERIHLQYVSGSMFEFFGIQPAEGRMLSAQDDDKPGASPFAVITSDYWERRFAKDPGIVGRTFKLGDRVYQIVGVAAPPFTGTEPGTMVDVFVPISMQPYINQPIMQYIRIFARIPSGGSPERLTAKLQPAEHAFIREQLNLRPGLPAAIRERIIARKLVVRPAPSGSSALQKNNGSPLLALCVLSGLVLLIACVNVANLVAAQTAARERELALRVSIGGGTRRLVQLVLAESAWIGGISVTLERRSRGRLRPS